jgi:hypothetical protein
MTNILYIKYDIFYIPLNLHTLNHLYPSLVATLTFYSLRFETIDRVCQRSLDRMVTYRDHRNNNGRQPCQ